MSDTRRSLLELHRERAVEQIDAYFDRCIASIEDYEFQFDRLKEENKRISSDLEALRHDSLQDAKKIEEMYASYKSLLKRHEEICKGLKEE